MGKIISYSRGSSKAKSFNGEESVSHQLSSIKNYAEQNNLVIEKQFTDVFTDSDSNVPQLIEMLKFLQDNPNSVDEVVFYSIDRLGRDLGGKIKTFLEVEKNVQRIYFLSENIDSKQEFFKTYFLLWTAVAETNK
ncbi:recombinase family protein [Bacillus sp. MUM 13]|uniref:recombinase family protein n=1 Tax=Bacillus sp. MUM 13 TaxID=1678001 RepID=UPI0008F5DFBC|nr:recombinase family protein [Bacillus sp. MUM 13]OIK10062.1 hypothetical protein BIV59_15110 [Bacillus sp. MUM 13]